MSSHDENLRAEDYVRGLEMWGTGGHLISVTAKNLRSLVKERELILNAHLDWNFNLQPRVFLEMRKNDRLLHHLNQFQRYVKLYYQRRNRDVEDAGHYWNLKADFHLDVMGHILKIMRPRIAFPAELDRSGHVPYCINCQEFHRANAMAMDDIEEDVTGEDLVTEYNRILRSLYSCRRTAFEYFADAK